MDDSVCILNYYKTTSMKSLILQRYNTGLTGNQGSLINHKAGRFICHICNKRFTKPSLLRRHEFVHLPDKPFEVKKILFLYINL